MHGPELQTDTLRVCGHLGQQMYHLMMPSLQFAAHALTHKTY